MESWRTEIEAPVKSARTPKMPESLLMKRRMKMNSVAFWRGIRPRKFWGKGQRREWSRGRGEVVPSAGRWEVATPW